MRRDGLQGPVTSRPAGVPGPQVGAQPATSRQVYRQRSSVGLAGMCGVTGLLLLLSLARSWADYPQPLFVAWVVFILAVAWSVFVRPAVLLDVDGVTLRNVVRDVQIPWTELTDVTCRWNLKVFAGDRGYTAWAISSQVERPKGASGGMFGMPLPGRGRLDRVTRAEAKEPTADPKVTAQSVTRWVRQAKEEYDEAVAQGSLTASADGRVRVTYVPLVMAVLLVTAAVVVALSLG